MELDRNAGAEPGLSLGRIARTAIELADAHGLAALSMRRIATALDAGVMSLYRHVPGKTELVDLMVETVFGEIHYPEPGPAGWRARLELSARREWAMYRRHPWVLPIVAGSSRPPLGPNVLANLEWVLRAVDGFGLAPATMVQVYFTVSDYVQGAARYVETETEHERRTGVTAEQWWAAERGTLAELLGTGRFPLTSRLVQRLGAAPALVVKDFEFGLARVLDGLAVLLSARPPRTAPTGSDAGTGDGAEVATRHGDAVSTRLEKVTILPGSALPPATAAAFELLGRRWTLELLHVLRHGEVRFRDLAEAVPGISRRVLTERLRQLADEGLLRRVVVTGPPTRISYALTERGAGLRRALAEIGAWAAATTPPAGRSVAAGSEVVGPEER